MRLRLCHVILVLEEGNLALHYDEQLNSGITLRVNDLAFVEYALMHNLAEVLERVLVEIEEVLHFALKMHA